MSEITRRDFINGTLMVAGSSMWPFEAYGLPCRDERRHQVYAALIAEHFDLDVAGAEQILAAQECLILPHHHPGNAVEEDRSRAHVARR